MPLSSQYSVSDFTGQSRSFSREPWEEKTLKFLPVLDCLGRAAGVNTAPSGVFLYPFRFSFEMSAERDGRVSASNMTVYKDNSFKDKF